MKIDLHIHTSTGSDGNLSVEEVLREARKRKLDLISITDHDSIDAQAKAITLAKEHGIAYVTGIELNVTFSSPGGKSVSLDFLGYCFDINDQSLRNKLQLMRKHREDRASQILKKLNIEFDKENIPRFTERDLEEIQASVDGTLGRPHIADYLITKGIVGNRQEAFDRYLVKCDVPKYPLTLPEASELIRNAGGRLVLAHPNNPNGTSLISLTTDLKEQTEIIQEHMLDYIDGVECWHSRNDAATTAHYIEFCQKNNLLMTGGSDCHQKPIILGTVDVPDFVAGQF
ncbi:MAG: PHP domain-containing protein [Dehalococcoidales bacterium]|nr:PHP domain-containing protein [Dehalococcoidales bacterium]